MKSRYTTLEVERIGVNSDIAHVQLNRPKKGNAMNAAFFEEFTDFFKKLASDTSIRVAVVSARGKYFTVGLDLKEFALVDVAGEENSGKKKLDIARRTYRMHNRVRRMQEVVSCMEKCPQPVIFCMHSYVLGGGMNIASAADIRYCSADALFSVKEIDIGISADLGVLQRIEKVIGSSSLARELCYTGRNLTGEEAERGGFVSKAFESKELCIAHGISVAEVIASKSPVAVAGTKMVLNFSRDNTISASLQYQSAWNAAMNQTEDVKKAAMASITKSAQPKFSNL